jgi:hypothetical protein
MVAMMHRIKNSSIFIISADLQAVCDSLAAYFSSNKQNIFPDHSPNELKRVLPAQHRAVTRYDVYKSGGKQVILPCS